MGRMTKKVRKTIFTTEAMRKVRSKLASSIAMGARHYQEGFTSSNPNL
jgi:hypothetical protein